MNPTRELGRCPAKAVVALRSSFTPRLNIDPLVEIQSSYKHHESRLKTKTNRQLPAAASAYSARGAGPQGKTQPYFVAIHTPGAFFGADWAGPISYRGGKNHRKQRALKNASKQNLTVTTPAAPGENDLVGIRLSILQGMNRNRQTLRPGGIASTPPCIPRRF